MGEFDYAAAMRAYADAINDLAARVSELEGQVAAIQEKCHSTSDHHHKAPSPEGAFSLSGLIVSVPMTDTHDHPEHKHVKFEAASLIAARLCTSCGSYVAASHLSEHQELHDLLVTLNPEKETQVELF